MSQTTTKQNFAPLLISRLFYVAAALIVLQTMFRGTPWVERLVTLFSIFIFPIDSSGLGFAALLGILGFALMRRKRLAWAISLGVLGLMLLVALSFFAVLVFQVVTNSPMEVASYIDLAEYILPGFSIGALITLLIAKNKDFRARTARANTRKALVVLIIGWLISAAISWILLWRVGGTGRPRNRLMALIIRLLNGEASTDVAPGWVMALFGFMVAVSFFIALMVLLRSQRQRATLPLTDEVTVRQLLAEHPDDSLGYFATRRDKSAVFAPDRQSAITYRVEQGVCLAAGDPLGRPEKWQSGIAAWLNHAHEFGWSPAVVGASEAGALAYTQAGLRAIRVGDEAILRPANFDLESRDLRPVRAAVHKLRRAGYESRIRRHDQITDAEMKHLVALADSWREGGPERGFSMALGRLGDDLDGQCLLVEALFPEDHPKAGQSAGMLSFVPWGRDGLSLDLMRRSPEADNGVTEFMVVALMNQGREFGVQKVSLNFAVFRSVFEEGSRVGATPWRRLQRRLLMVASRWFQIEQLYRSNVKYAPDWQPRFMCYEDATDIGGVGLAMGIAEGFVDLPKFLYPFNAPEQPLVRLADHPGLELPGSKPEELPKVRVPDQMRARLATREQLLESGVEAYPASFYPDSYCSDVNHQQLGRQIVLAGRVIAVRDYGGVIFVRLQDWTGEAQILLEANAVGVERLKEFDHQISLGDHVGFEGTIGHSRKGQLSLLATSWTLTAKSLRPLPDQYAGISDPETRVRQRYLDLIVNPSARHHLNVRSAALRSVRDTLHKRGYMEVETPILQTIHGGANARPFRTHINAYDLDLYLRIAPELFLKKLMVGGVDRVFEIGRNFRNEGADATHNPEFTMLEAYQAYGDYTVMREVAQEIIVQAAKAANGTTIVQGTDHEGKLHEVDLGQPFKVTTVNQAISEAAGVEVSADSTKDELVDLADSLKINNNPAWTRGDVLLELYEHLVEDRTVAPTFYCDFPAEVSPLTRGHREDDRLAERWDLVAFGAEIGTAYSELVDPVVQRNRLTAQSLLAAGGDPEAMELDESFLEALEYAMPPSGGLGMGMDRLVMMLTNTSIRETIAFPLVRPRRF